MAFLSSCGWSCCNASSLSFTASTRTLILPPKLSLLAPLRASSGDEQAKDISSSGDVLDNMPSAVKLALQRAKEYKDKKINNSPSTGQQKVTAKNSVQSTLENNFSKKETLKVSSLDFKGFEFSDKKKYRGLPPGLTPVVDQPFDGDLPEVEIIVGDASKFGDKSSSPVMDAQENKDNTVLYKPKVSTWGVFPRPNNISKTYGGGRVIQPGQELERAEEKESKEKYTRELLAAYKKKMGLTIDPKVKAECEKTLEEGDRLMDLGKLQEALPFYEKVMKDIIFQSELHGLAALQWSICQDSLRRTDVAKVMYEKLQSHPNAQVSKKAKQFVFSFQATEMMKVRNLPISRRTGYESYFDAFVEDKSNITSAGEENDEGSLNQAIPYLMFMISPVFFVLLLVASKY